MALKAISTWVDHGVLKEEETDQYKLLNVAEADDGSRPRAGKWRCRSTEHAYTDLRHHCSGSRCRATARPYDTATTGGADASLLEGMSLTCPCVETCTHQRL